MKIILPALFALVFCCANDKKEPFPVTAQQVTDHNLVTGHSWGLITAHTGISELKKIYGERNVKDERICGAECLDSVDVTTLYAGTAKEITIYWEDSQYHRQAARIECGAPGAPYHTAGGIRIGSSLRLLLKKNGRPINFSGFGWDYGGSILSFNKGLLERSKIFFQLEPTGNYGNSLMGDVDLNTGMPAVKKLLDRIVVSRLSLSFYKDE